MNCEEIRKNLDDFLLGELDPAVEMQVNAHVEDCASCRQEMNLREKSINFFKKAHLFTPSPLLFERIKQYGRIYKKQSISFLPNWAKSLAFAAAAFVLGMVCLRGVDMILLNSKSQVRSEQRNQPSYRAPFSDTVKFYAAPSKHLVQI